MKKRILMGILLAVLFTFFTGSAAFAGPYNNHPWASTFLNALYDKGAISSYENTEGNALRREIARYVVMSYNFPYGGKSFSFSDVSGSTADVESIEKAASCGIINGYSDGTFRPNDTVARAEAAVILAKAMTGNKVPSYSGSPFPDVSSSHWARDAIAYCKQWNVIRGYPNGTFQPDGRVTRAEVATMVYTALQAHPGLPNVELKQNPKYDDGYDDNDYDEDYFEHQNPKYRHHDDDDNDDDHYRSEDFEHQNPKYNDNNCDDNYDDNYNSGNFEHQNPEYSSSSNNNFEHQNNDSSQNLEHTNPY